MHAVDRVATAPEGPVKLTGGEAGGRPLKGPRGLKLRPTSDRVREALFDILGGRVTGALFLDAFAGTGAVGVEALSRGARRAVFLERNRSARRLIEQNAAVGAWDGRFEILGGDAAASIAVLAGRAERVTIAFVDPPYEIPPSARLLSGIVSVMEPGGVLVVEHRSSINIDWPSGESYPPERVYRYGDSALSVVRLPRRAPAA